MPRLRALATGFSAPGRILVSASLAALVLWGYYALPSKRAPLGGITLNLIGGVVFSLLLIAILFWAISKDRVPAYLIIVIAVYVMDTGVVNFTATYWAIGTYANFHQQLSKIDALYFAVGTFTTAGTGTIAAHSQLARLVQTLQMIIDFAVVAVALAIIVSRLASRYRAPDVSRGESA
jgi:hypothetical protein